MAYCSVCGYDAGDKDTCPACKAKIYETYEGEIDTGKKRKNRGGVPRSAKIFSIISLATGIYSLVGLNIIAGIAAIVLACLYKNKTDVKDVKVKIGKTLGILGIIASIVAMIVYCIFMIVCYVAYIDFWRYIFTEVYPTW